MPWSDWQEPFEVPMTASTLQLQYHTGSGGVVIGSDQFESSFTYFEGFYGYTVIGYQYQRPPIWETYRTFPWPMFDLEEGVDYVEVPDRPGVYYEYQDEPNTFIGWEVPALVLSLNHDPLATRTFQLLMELGTTYAQGDALEFDTARGTPVGRSWNGNTAEGTVIATPAPGPAVSSFSLWPSVPQPFDFSQENAYEEYLPYISVRVRTRLPRWRYWKPDAAPRRYARLIHRGDGLGMSTRRLVGGRNTHQTGRLRGSF